MRDDLIPKLCAVWLWLTRANDWDPYVKPFSSPTGSLREDGGLTTICSGDSLECQTSDFPTISLLTSVGMTVSKSLQRNLVIISFKTAGTTFCNHASNSSYLVVKEKVYLHHREAVE